MDLHYWRRAFSILIAFLLELFIIYYGQGQQNQRWPNILSTLTLLHHLLALALPLEVLGRGRFHNAFGFVLLLADVVLNLAEAGGMSQSRTSTLLDAEKPP